MLFVSKKVIDYSKYFKKISLFQSQKKKYSLPKNWLSLLQIKSNHVDKDFNDKFRCLKNLIRNLK